LALAVPVLPLGNVALGAALFYAAVAVGIVALSWREPGAGLLFVLGPLLAPLWAIGLVPLATLPLRASFRRGAQAAAAVLVAGVVAGLRGARLPFDGARPPHLHLAATGDPFTVLGALWTAVLDRPSLAVETLVFAAVAVLLPHTRARGLWAIAVLGAGFLAAALLLVPAVAAAPLVVCVWATCAAVAVR
jgi:hypothetical protein